jgi:hypothetical protein
MSILFFILLATFLHNSSQFSPFNFYAPLNQVDLFYRYTFTSSIILSAFLTLLCTHTRSFKHVPNVTQRLANSNTKLNSVLFLSPCALYSLFTGLFTEFRGKVSSTRASDWGSPGFKFGLDNRD